MHPDSHSLLQATRDRPSDPPPSLVSSGNSSSPCTPVKNIKRNINRDSSQITNSDDGKYWDAWSKKTLDTARAQDIAEVLSTECSPLTPDKVLLFEEKNKLMCSIFATTL